MAVLKYWDPDVNDYVPLVTTMTGTILLSGEVPPSSDLGIEGNFYIDFVGHVLYGPKTGDYWPTALTEGAGTGGATYEVSFTTASDTWTIHHNLGTRFVEINCYDPTGVDEYDVEADIVDANTAIVHWYYPTTGIARVMA